MPTVKQYNDSPRYLLATAAPALPLMAVTAAAIFRAWSGMWDAWTWAGLAVSGVGTVAYFFWNYRRLTRMRCPDCGEMIVRPIGAAGDPVNFLCRRCDVEWHTRLRRSED